MNESKISVRYAKALFESAAGQNMQDQVYQDMEVLEAICKLEDFRYMLVLPSLQPSQKQAIILQILEKQICELTVSLISLVVKNKRELSLQGIARYFKELYRKDKGIMSARLLSASAIDKESMEGFKALIARAYESEVELHVEIKEELIGGFVLTVEDKQYDASLSTGLRKIKNELLQTSIENK